ncbi:MULTISPECIES: DEAD/DEAH box helicase [unclassified Microbacterium]|uniref:DEAD/DEAH box helicase n=1 Tax=Microbacterium TaxID=33882 RepID=UPI003B9F81E6
MPKNKKPAGGRPAQNFDPRYAKKKPGGPFRGNDGASRGPRRDDARPARDGDRFDRSSSDRFERRDDRGFGGQRREGGYAGQRREGGYERREGGFNGQRREGGFAGRDNGQRREGGFERREGGFNGQRREGFAGRVGGQRREGGYERREGGYAGQRREGGFERREDRGFGGQRREGGYQRREGGYERPRFNRDDRTERPRFARDDRAPRADRPSFRDDRPRRDERPARSAAQEQQIDVVHERLEAQAIQTTEAVDVSFGELGLGDNIERALAELGAAKPFPIQAATIPSIIEGRDVLARGRTGSGKTIAFGAPLVERVLRSKAGQKREFGRAPVALILAPTRELALQIDRTIQPIARSVGLFTTQIYGGVPQARQVGALKKGVDIIIGTPGRMEDLHAQGKLDLSQISIAVLDEADHMCELGFLEPVQRLLRLTADGSQKLLFSATLDREVAALVDEFLVEPSVYEVAGETQDSGTIDHRVLVIDQRSKGEILETLVDREGKTLVFSRTRAYAEQLVEQFEDAGLTAVALHGDLNQAKRTRNIEKFSKGRAQVLVATDVAARGIHVDDVDLVVQADAPTEYKTYLHRAGRTGRAGREGRVVTLITRMRQRRMSELLERAEIDAPFDQVRPGDDLLEELAGAPTAEQLTA